MLSRIWNKNLQTEKQAVLFDSIDEWFSEASLYIELHTFTGNTIC